MDNCIFCKIARHQSRAWMVHETDASCAFLDVNPMNPYHTRVIPKRHFADIFSIPTEGLQELMGTLKSVVDLYHRQLNLTSCPFCFAAVFGYLKILALHQFNWKE